MAEIADLAILDANNVARFPEGQKIPTLNNGARALEGIIGRAEQDRNGTILTSGSATAYAILTNAAYPSLAAGQWFRVRIHTTNTGTATFQINALTAKPLKRQTGSDLVAGDLPGNMLATIIYNAATDCFDVVGVGDGVSTVPTYTVANLPTSGPTIAIASNGRKNGEGGGSGTGVFCFRVNTSWFACDTGAAVSA